MELTNIKQQISELNSTEFLDIIETECAKRKVDRTKVMGTNDIEINKINLLLTDKFWMRKIYLILTSEGYKGFKYNRPDAELEANTYLEANRGNTWYGATYFSRVKEEIVDLRDVY